jgi:hypothetical protein
VLDTPVFSVAARRSTRSAWAPRARLRGRDRAARQTAAMLRLLGIEELIAQDGEHYAALAQQLLARPRALRALRAAIAARAPAFQPEETVTPRAVPARARR